MVSGSGSARATAIGSDELAEFALSVGPLPDEPVRPCSSGRADVRRRCGRAGEESSTDGAEPERPRRFLTLVSATDDAVATDETDAVLVASTEPRDNGEALARTLGGGGAVLGAAALRLVLVGRRRTTR